MAAAAWRLARQQHWVITREQLHEIGYAGEAIDHRIEYGRLYPIHVGVYAVRRPDLTREGYFIAAVLACGPCRYSLVDPCERRNAETSLRVAGAGRPTGRRTPRQSHHRHSI